MPHRLLQVDVQRATNADSPLLTALLQFYIYDFSAFEDPASGDLAFDDSGAFRISIALDAYLNEPDRWAYVFRCNNRPAGFALINTVSHAGQQIDFNMGEFFVARKYRRSGVATRALHQILHYHPGRWEVAVIEPNSGAKAFWPRAIRAATGASGLKRVKHDAASWNGPIWTFLASPA